MKKNILLFLLVSTFFSCLSEKEKAEKDKLSYAQIEKMAIVLQEGFLNDDIKSINSLYDKRALANRFLQSTSQKRILEFNNGFYRGFSREFNFGEILITEKSNNDALYDFVNLYEDENENYHILFRFFSKDGINYHDHLIKKVNNQPKIIDTYIFLSGEFLSDTYRAIYKSTLHNTNYLTGDFSNSRFVKDFEKLQKIRGYINSKNYEKAKRIYESISEYSKKEKIFKLTNITISNNLSIKEYEAAILDYEKEYPNDPSLYLISIDSHLLKGDYKGSLAAIDKLDKYIKGDSFLNFLRGNVYTHQKDYKSATEKINLVIEDYPDFFDAYNTLLTLYLETQNRAEAVKILDVFVNKFEVVKLELKMNLSESYPRFVKSKEFKNWYE